MQGHGLHSNDTNQRDHSARGLESGCIRPWRTAAAFRLLRLLHMPRAPRLRSRLRIRLGVRGKRDALCFRWLTCRAHLRPQMHDALTGVSVGRGVRRQLLTLPHPHRGVCRLRGTPVRHQSAATVRVPSAQCASSDRAPRLRPSSKRQRSDHLVRPLREPLRFPISRQQSTRQAHSDRPQIEPTDAMASFIVD